MPHEHKTETETPSNDYRHKSTLYGKEKNIDLEIKVQCS